MQIRKHLENWKTTWINAGKIIEEKTTIEEAGDEIFQQAQSIAAGRHGKSEALGHQEFILTHKSFEPIGPIGPRVVMRNKIEDVLNLDMWLEVNGR